MSISMPLGAISGGELAGTEFGQKLSMQEQEAFHLTPDFYDRSINSQYLEVYLYWAAIERKREAEDQRPIPDAAWTVLFKQLTGRRDKIIWGDEEPLPTSEAAEIAGSGSDSDREKVGGIDQQGNASLVTTAERERAYRVLRVASWQAVFYLITTDILGFTAASESFQELGYGPGVMVYTFLYILAVFAGQVIWYMYLHLDSSRFPVICYADLGERTFGRAIRHIFNIFQSLQLIFNVALLINGNAETLEVLANFKMCFLVAAIVWFAVGAIGGQIQSLKNFAWFANCNIWLNIITMIMTIYGCAKYLPVPSESEHTNLDQPVIHTAWVPGYTVGWYEQVSGVQLAVFAYGGAMIFPEFMAEMRRPRDFWKAALCAQLFCYLVYMMFGIVIYTYQGQYASILPGLDFQNRGLILANNIISLFTTIVAAVLYGNIGVKVFYENVLRCYFKAPSMITKKGRIIFSVTAVVYWLLGWIIGVAIPFLSALITLVGSLFILQFTYTFPPILILGHWMQRDALKGDNPWTPGLEPGSTRIDTWKQMSRWKRGFKSYWYAKAFLALLFVAALANCALGVYSGVETAITSFKAGFGAPFSCRAPNAPAS